MFLRKMQFRPYLVFRCLRAPPYTPAADRSCYIRGPYRGGCAAMQVCVEVYNKGNGSKNFSDAASRNLKRTLAAVLRDASVNTPSCH
jgi:hypothetical protein